MSHTFWAIAVLSLLSSLAMGQVVPDAPQENADKAELGQGEIWPRLIYLLDKDGKPTIPYLDFDWERFNLVDGSIEPRVDPPFLLSEVQVEAEVEQDKALLEVRLVVHCLVDGPQLVPIQLGNAHFRKQPKSKHDEVVRARFAQNFGEYELLIDGQQGKDLEVTFSLIAPLQRIGQVTKLRLQLPRAAVSSMDLVVPRTDVIGHAASGVTFRTEREEESTRFRFDGLDPKFAFQWHPDQVDVVETTTSFEVESQLDVRVESAGSVTTDAQFKLLGLQRPLERIQIRLPKRARWIATEATSEAYTIQPTETSGRQLLEVIFTAPTSEPPSVRILVESARSDESYELAGFEVLEASSQFGRINLYSLGDHRLAWNTGDFVQRTNAGAGAKASFLFYQPNQIQMTVARQPKELMVEPVYVVHVAEDRATLTAIYRCTASGAAISELSLDMGTWTYGGLGRDPQNLIDQNDLRPVDGTLTLPLSDAPSEFEIAIIATRSIDEVELFPADADATPTSALEFEFPVPDGAQRILPSTVAVVANSDIVVAPAEEATNYSLISPPVAVLDELDEEANPLCLRSRVAGAPQPLPFAIARLQRVVTVRCETDILEVGSESLRVQQRMQWDLNEVPLPWALLTIPKRVSDYGNPQFTIDGQTKIHQRYFTFGDADSDRYIVKVPLDRMIGSFEMTVTYDWENSELTMDEVLVDLILPSRDTNLVRSEQLQYSNLLRRPRVQGYQISLSASGNADMDFDWTSSLGSAPLDAEVEARTDELLPQIPLSITQVSPDVAATPFEALVDQSWYQTWYTDSERTDRAVFRVRGADQTLQIGLPEDIDFRKLHAWIDGRKVEFLREGPTAIRLNVNSNALYHVVELRYARERTSPPGVLETRVPVIEGADMIGQWYWHLVMPRNESLVSWPRSLTRAHQWDWSTLIPRVTPQLRQADLENWSGSMRVQSNVLYGSSEYLFGAMGEPEKLWVRTAPLPIYVITVAGSILVFGLLLLQAKRRHRLGILCVAAGVIAAVVYVHPSYGAVGGQVVVLGTVLVVIAGTLKWLHFGLSRRRNVPVREPRSTRIDQLGSGPGFSEHEPTVSSTLPATIAPTGSE